MQAEVFQIPARINSNNISASPFVDRIKLQIEIVERNRAIKNESSWLHLNPSQKGTGKESSRNRNTDRIRSLLGC